jgi:hypothetical protein
VKLAVAGHILIFNHSAVETHELVLKVWLFFCVVFVDQRFIECGSI